MDNKQRIDLCIHVVNELRRYEDLHTLYADR